MVVLLTGASGFIGRHVADALAAAGHEVVCAVRDPSRLHDARFRHVQADFTRDFAAADWLPRLAGVDAVINAVGIIRETGGQTFEAIHDRAPRALFAACVEAGVQRVVQVSALGADAQAQSQYHLSKKRADDFLRSLPLPSVIIQPSLVFGAGGTSARLFTTIASLPLVGLPGAGRQQVQPVHLDDVVASVVAALEAAPREGSLTVPVVGPRPMALRDFFGGLRRAMGMGRALFVPTPMPLVRLGAAAGSRLPSSLLDPETLQMLERGNTGNAAPLTALLGRSPRPLERFIPAADVPSVRLRAQLGWLLPLLRISIALVWIVTGIVSLGLYPVQDSYALLGRTGIPPVLQPLMLYGAALLDFAFGVGTLALRGKWRRRLWLAQFALILFYTFIITWRLPEFWLHPYGPLLKNLPMLAAIWLLFELEEKR